MDPFLRGYIEAALWASIDDEGEPIDASYDIDDIAPETLAVMQADCADFEISNLDDLADLDSYTAGVDFWLTRNGHGAGFWDRDLGDVGDRLTDAAHAYGEFNLYVGDDGRIYEGEGT